MSVAGLECADLLALKNSEIAALHEELQRERLRREAVQSEADLTFEKLLYMKKQNDALKAQIDSWVKIADEEAALKKQLERQGYEL